MKTNYYPLFKMADVITFDESMVKNACNNVVEDFKHNSCIGLDAKNPNPFEIKLYYVVLKIENESRHTTPFSDSRNIKVTLILFFSETTQIRIVRFFRTSIDYGSYDSINYGELRNDTRKETIEEIVDWLSKSTVTQFQFIKNQKALDFRTCPVDVNENFDMIREKGIRYFDDKFENEGITKVDEKDYVMWNGCIYNVTKGLMKAI